MPVRLSGSVPAMGASPAGRATSIHALHCGGDVQDWGVFDPLDERAGTGIYNPYFMYVVHAPVRARCCSTPAPIPSCAPTRASGSARRPTCSTPCWSPSTRCPAAWPRIGLEPTDIDVVVQSHLHFDHAGGLEHLGARAGLRPAGRARLRLRAARRPGRHLRAGGLRRGLRLARAATATTTCSATGACASSPPRATPPATSRCWCASTAQTVFLLSDAAYLVDKMRARRLPGVLWSAGGHARDVGSRGGDRARGGRAAARHARGRLRDALPDGARCLVRVAAAAKDAVLEATRAHVAPHRVGVWDAFGTQLVMGRREGYRMWDLSGHALLDFHLNGGTFNLGHRNPEVIAALVAALDEVDIGNHHFASPARAALGRGAGAPDARRPHLLRVLQRRQRGHRRRHQDRAARHRPPAAGGARRRLPRPHRPQRRGGRRRRRPPLPVRPAGRLHEGAVRRRRRRWSGRWPGGDVAAVLLETVPATYGFPVPPAGLPAGGARGWPRRPARCTWPTRCRRASAAPAGCGASRPSASSPTCWSAGKGLSGGIYPAAACVISERAAGWLHEFGWGHVSTFGGSELGCRVALRVLELTTRPETVANVAHLIARYRDGLRAHPARASRGWSRSARAGS